uniref:Uncharacterized protein n=1 Tax=Anguilla anguilla TaxID=7936 RepID=A0A0E9VSH2_ANGAN
MATAVTCKNYLTSHIQIKCLN